MKLQSLLYLPSTLVLVALSTASAVPEQSYSEHLYLKPLPNNHLHADFNFTATTPLAAYDAQHFRYFPRSLAQILQHTHTAELHLRFGLGRWDEEQWGSRPQHGRREGGTGVELWAWVEGNQDEADARWADLVNSLSGLFCASLNFVDSTKTIRPVMSFEPEGIHPGGNTDLHLLHGMLPHEVVCTENLTPFLKMLPCKGKAGISSLLDGHKLFDASWQSMAVDVRPICPTTGSSSDECLLEVQQTVSMALSIPRSMRDRHNPIPRPPPIEEIECDRSKVWNGRDTCYPKPFDDDLDWTLSQVFGRPIQGACPLGSDGDWDVSLDVPTDRTVDVLGNASSSTNPKGRRQFKLEPGNSFDLALPRQGRTSSSTPAYPPLFASRQMTGYGQERGGMHATLRNPHPYPQTIVFLENLPWFLKPYMHTLAIQHGTIDKMYYSPALDRERGTHLELLITIPALSTAELNYDFEKAILRYTEYPPDANRGFDVAPAVIRVLHSNASDIANKPGEDEYLRTTSLLLPLPTPDFSMPYNVIILSSTVIALGFGSIFNMLVRKFVLLEEVPASPLKVKVMAIKEKLAVLLGKKNGAPADSRDSGGSKQDLGAADTAQSSSATGRAPANGEAHLRHPKT